MSTSGCLSFISAMPSGAATSTSAAHVGAALALQHVDGGDHGAAGGEHVDDQRYVLAELADELLEVRHRLQRLVARDADHADLEDRHHVEHAIEHAQPGAQDRHHGDLRP